MRRVVIAVVVVLACLGMGAPASAATGWSLMPAPASAKEPSDSLAGISCGGVSMCMAVGASGPISGAQQPLAEVWNGSRWSVTRAVRLKRGGLFDAASCTSPVSCIAVGNTYNKNFSPLPLAEAWNGASWSVQSMPVPAGSSSIIVTAVTCAAAGTCTAVGSYVNHHGTQRPLAESWNGTAWALLSARAPKGAFSSSLAGVWCISANACVAVGNSGTSSGTTSVLAETWNGTAWSIRPTPDPTNESYLSGVACPAAGDCIAVGGSTSNTLVESWNGTNWSVVPSPSTGSQADLTSLACTSASACTAVGTSQGTNNVATLAEAWNGSAWTIQPTPNPASYGLLLPTTFAAVGCTSASRCTAVGGYANRSAAQVILGETWGGTRWALTSLPEVRYTENTGLSAVTCTSPTACTAVGSVLTASNGLSQPVAETWNGTKWKVRELPGRGNLTGISCSTATACTAVGVSPTEQSGVGGLAERWNGTKWTQQALVVASPHGYRTNGVACPAAAYCIAVGQGNGGLAEVWNGTKWALQSQPPGGSSLAAIACTSRSACTAVGETAAFASWAGAWNGSAWSQQTIPNDGSLAAVACPGSSECLAAGYGPVAEEWNGTAWATQTVPSPTGKGALSALACPSTNACTAVGGTGATGTQAPLAEAWNGTAWAIQATPAPAGVAGSLLAGVSCPSPTVCLAVGYSTSNSGKERPLAETYTG